MSVSDDVANTLRAQSKAHYPIVVQPETGVFPDKESTLQARDGKGVGRIDTWGRLVVERQKAEEDE